MKGYKKGIIIGILITLVVVIIGVYFGYKEMLYKEFYKDKEMLEINKMYINGLNNKLATINIKTQEVDDYITNDNIKIKNDFTDFSQKTAAVYVMNSNENVYISLIKSESLLSTAKKLNNKNLNKIIQKNKITNDIDLLTYIASNYQEIKKSASIKEMQEANSLKELVSLISINIDSLTLIDGDYKGYMYTINNSDMKVVNIIKNANIYSISFRGLEYFNDNYLNELLNTIIIEES